MATRAHPVNDRIDKTLSKRPPEPTPVPEIERPAVNLAKILQRTTLAPNSLRPAELLHLQRTLGNRAVGAILARPAASSPLIQAKLTVNAPGDEYEREADRVALRREEQVRTSPCEPLSPTVQRQHGRENENTTNIPDHLKAGIETLSGLSLDDVKVHYNSSKPARLEALVYTQGTDIHVGPGQEKHLAHEAWHVVQQKQGRVRPTLQMKDGIAINDDAGLEREADELGTKALQMGRPHHITTDSAAQTATAMQRAGETRDASAVAGAAIGSPEEKVRLNFLSTPDRSRLRSAAPATAPVRQMRFSLGERGQLAQLPQVANSGNVQGSIDVLRDHTTRLANDLIALAGFNDRANQRPTLQEMVQIDRFTNAHLGQLGNIQQINTWADIAQLAAGTRSVADLVTLAALQVGGATPTLQEMVGVNRFTINEIQTLSGEQQSNTWPAIVQLAAGTRSVQDLVQLARANLGNATPTLPEMVALGRFNLGDLGNVGQAMIAQGQVATWADFAQIAGLTRSANDLVTLSQALYSGRVPTRPEIVALDRFSLGELQNLMNTPQVNAWPDVVQLATGTRSAADLVTLSGHQINGAAPTLADMVAVDRFTLNEIQALSGQQASTWAAMVQLAGGTRSAQNLLHLAQATVNHVQPTLPEMVALERFSNTDIGNVGNTMGPQGQVASWADFAQLAGLTRSANDLVTLSGRQLGGRVPSRAEMVALDRFSLGELQNLGAHQALAAWDQLALLGPLARSANDLNTLAGLQVGGAGPTAAQLVTLDPEATNEITTLHGANLPQVQTWAGLVQLARLRTTAVSIIQRAQVQKGGRVPTLQELVDIDSYSGNELNSIGGLTQSWPQLVQGVSSVQGTLGAVINSSMTGVLQNDLVELANLLGQPAPDLWHYVATLIDMDHSLPSEFTNLEQRFIIGSLMRDSTYNSCFDGADRLVSLMGTENLQVSYTSGGAKETQYNQATQAQRAMLLGQHFAQAAALRTPILFRIHLGGHGFTLTTEHGWIYQVEMLAGAGDPGTLLQSILNGYTHTVANCSQHFADMTSAVVNNRINGADAMHWNAGPIAILAKSNPQGNYDIIKDPMEIWWTASPLLTRDQIVQRFQQKILQNRLALLNKIW